MQGHHLYIYVLVMNCCSVHMFALRRADLNRKMSLLPAAKKSCLWGTIVPVPCEASASLAKHSRLLTQARSAQRACHRERAIEGLQCLSAAPLKKTSADMARCQTLCSMHPRSS